MNSYLVKLTTKRFRQYFRMIDKMKHIDRWFTLMDTNTKRIHIDPVSYTHLTLPTICSV